MYAAQKTAALSASRSPEVLPRATLPPFAASEKTMNAHPPSASARPIQKDARGGRRRNSHVPRPTKIGALLPSSTAVAADVRSTALLNSARSAAKNAPPASASRAAGAVTGRGRRWLSRHGMRTSAAIDTR